ncbi:NfeD family protein [Novipirellula artificiosorum]|uniref:NfeD family protein n=1 Tax=Novipirellula artificiosorum TaxID=2528016 RepID=UPI0018CE8E89|nr:NfeD family protein [Novipirellula artificiosorum]
MPANANGWAPLVGVAFCITAFSVCCSSASAQQATESADSQANRVKVGYMVEVPDPLSADGVSNILAQLNRLAQSADDGSRVTVVLRYDNANESGGGTTFEDALRLARAMTQPELRRVRVVSWVRTEVSGHRVLPILASDLLIVSPAAVIADATKDETAADETIRVSYQSIAARRGLFPAEVVTALVDPAVELAKVTQGDGSEVFASGQELARLRAAGQVAGESILAAENAPLRMNASQLRSSRIAAGMVASDEAASELLDLAAINPVDNKVLVGEPVGVVLELVGSITDSRSRRWQSNLAATLESNEVNTWVIAIDSPGGNLNQSATLAGWFAQPDPPLHTVAGFVQGEARGDASLVALACRPLMMGPNARLGGPGAESITSEDVMRNDELIEQVARSTKRPAALIRGLLDPGLQVYRYTNRKTGRVRYATEEDLNSDPLLDAEFADADRDRWERGDRVELAEGLTAAEAIALGLADGQAASVDDASRRIGLSGTPPPVTDRSVVRWVERLGRSHGLAFLLLFIGFAALSTEANAPGLGVPGFVAVVCFALYFWIKFLAGTAEWLELLAFALGLICIAIEVFVIPGFGIFGVGGLALTVLGIVLMSQTFVIPRNVYQVEVLTHSLWAALGGVIGLIAGFIVIRTLMPHIPLLSGLAMEPADLVAVNEAEKLADFTHLLGQTGSTTTPLRPSGKARFGDSIVQVISDGTSIASGEAVRVSEVHGTRVIVEAIEG